MLSKEQQEICQPFLYTKWKVSTTADAANRAGGAAETSESGMAAAAGGGAAGAAAGGSAQTSQASTGLFSADAYTNVALSEHGSDKAMRRMCVHL